MKIKSLVLLTSGALMASAAFAATQATPVKSIHFTIQNKTNASISGVDVFPGITNLTPKTLPTLTLPVGTTNLHFAVKKVGEVAGVAVGGSDNLDISAGSDPAYQDLNYTCQSYNPLYRTQCVANVNADGVYTVTTEILPTITK